jgi:uncharacterized protein (DUF1499 family)
MHAESVARAVPRTARILAWLGLGLGIACALAELIAGIGHRLGWWDYRLGIGILVVSAWVALGALLASIVGSLLATRNAARRLLMIGVAGLIAAALAAGIPAYYYSLARHVPPIHDISTDTDDPPRFVAALAARSGAQNGVEYSADTAAQQRRAYPDIRPALIDIPPGTAFARALAAARSRGWEILASVPAEGRIEAVDTSLLFGFKDDIVIRVAANGEGSRVDVRSLSRVGRSDIGANARRIRAFLGELGAR